MKLDRSDASVPLHFPALVHTWDPIVSRALGVVIATGLFLFVALSQMLGDFERKPQEITEIAVFQDIPEVEEIEEEPPPEEEVEEDVPELAEETPTLTLDQLDIALNPGTGGAIQGDYSLAHLGRMASRNMELDTEEFVDFADLDRVPRPIGVSGLNFPRRLRQQKVNGRVTLLLKLNEDGDVLDVSVESSDLPHFDAFIVGQVREWKFTPPTKQGKPVRAKARLPIPIRIG